MTDLTNKQRAFIEEYLQCWNATEAARRAGYQGDDNTLGVVGYENLRKPKIAERVRQRLKEKAMSADEALSILAEQVRFDPGPYLIVDNDYGVGIAVQRMIDAGITHLIKAIVPTSSGTRIEFYDKQAALNMILRAQGAFTDNVDVTSGGKPVDIQIREVIVELPDDESVDDRG